MMAIQTPVIWIELNGERYTVWQLQGKEQISEPFSFQIAIIQPENSLSENFLAATARVAWQNSNGHVLRQILGIVTQSWMQIIDRQGKNCWNLIVEPRLSYLKNSTGPRVYRQKSVPDITQELLQTVGYGPGQVQFNLQTQYPKLPYLMQGIGESDLVFLQRQLSKAGIFFWSDVSADGAKEYLCFSDNVQTCSFLNESIQYTPSSGLVNLTSGINKGDQCLSLQWNTQRPNLQIRDHDELHPDVKILAEQPGGLAYFSHEYFGPGIVNNSQAQELVKHQAACHNAEQVRCQFISHLPTLRLGYRVQMQADSFQSDISENFLITALQHQLMQVIEGLGTAFPYTSMATLWSSDYVPRPKLRNHPLLPAAWSAKVESKSDDALLDEHGRYRVRQHFDQSDAEVGQATPPLSRINPYGNNSNATDNPNTAWHYGLRDNSEVWLSALHGDPNRPIILGSAHNANDLSPVVAANSVQHRFVSVNQSESLFDDNSTEPKINLQTASGFNQLEMSAKPDAHHINVITQQGALTCQAKQQVDWQTDADSVETIANNRWETATNLYQLQTQQGDIVQQSAQNHANLASNNINFLAAENITLQANQSFLVNARQHVRLLIAGEQTLSSIENGNCVIQAGNAVKVKSLGDGSIEICQQDAGIQLTADGEIVLYGKQVNFISNSVSEMLGKVNLQGAVRPPQSSTLSSPLSTQSIPDLQPDQNQLRLVTDTLTIYLNYLDKQEPCKLLSFLEGARYRIFGDFILGNSQNQIFTGVVHDAKIILEQFDVTRGFYIELWDPKTGQMLYCAAKQTQQCRPLSLCFVDAHIGSITAIQDSNLPEKIKKFRSVYLTVIPPLQYFNFRIENLTDFEAVCEHYQVNLMPRDRQLIQDNLIYFGSKKSNSASYRRGPFGADEIKFFKDNGNNVTFFIHGYDVPLGNFGDAFELMVYDSDSSRPEILGFKNKAATIYRDPDQNIPTRYNNLTSNKIMADNINGSGACHWQIMMSQSLNNATNQFNDYTKYNSVIGIFWQGDPVNPLDYIAAVRLAKYPGLLLAKVLKPLIDAGIKVNIIAHSLGNLVLVNALDVLGKGGESVNHVFMWEPAIPDNVFTTDVPRDPFAREFYYLPYAHQGSKKFTILFSENDNILGPLPTGNFKTILEAIYERSEDPCASVILGAIAATFSSFDLTSLPQPVHCIYHIANMAQVALSEILTNPHQRLDYYHHWQLLHPYDMYARSLMPNLEDQVNLMKVRYPKTFAALSAVLYFLQNKNVTALGREKTDKWEKIKNSLIDFVNAAIEPNHQSIFNESVDVNNDNNSDETAGLLITIFLTQLDVKPAMGCAGADYQNEKIAKQLYHLQKLYLVNQKSWLYSHVGMKVPDKALMENVYKKYIIGGDGIKEFGRYCC